MFVLYPLRFDSQKKKIVAQLRKDSKFLLFYYRPQRNHLIFGSELLWQTVFERLNTVRKKKAQWDEHSQQKLWIATHPEECFADNVRSCFFRATMSKHSASGSETVWHKRTATTANYFLHWGQALPHFLSNFTEYRHFSHSAFPLWEQNPSWLASCTLSTLANGEDGY